MSIDMLSSVSQLLSVERTFERPREGLAGRIVADVPYARSPGPRIACQTVAGPHEMVESLDTGHSDRLGAY
jgi:hypothetical protein